MKNIIQKYRQMSFEQKTIFKTIFGLIFSTILSCVKLIIGFFIDYNLCVIAIYTFAILLAKLECVLGVKTQTRSFKTRNILISVFLLVSSAIYIGFMCRMFFIDRKAVDYTLNYVVLLAFISFMELGFAITGLIRTKNKGHYYRNIKIINFCVAIIAILTTQMTILDFTAKVNTDIYNAYAGIGVGCFIVMCAIYILFAPRISVIDREHNVFVLQNEKQNELINMSEGKVDLLLCTSKVYGSYKYCGTIIENKIDGNIERGPKLWKQLHILLKILVCILSEILIFVWLIGYLIFALRNMNVPRRLENKMIKNGFEKVNNLPWQLELSR